MKEKRNLILEYFHKNNLLNIKEALGKSCTFIAHVRYKDKYMVEAKFKGIKPIVAQLKGTPSDIKAEYYMQLKNDMVNEARKRGIL